MANKKALGKGLGAIISASPTPVDDMEMGFVGDTSRIIEIDVNTVSPNPDQPRSRFDEHEIRGLAESIRSVGLIQPIIVRKAGTEYVVIAGERRLRACKLAEIAKIKAIVIEAGEVDNLTLALIENIQRENLDPIEEARAYRVLVNRFKLKQQDIAEKVGKDRATIANALRLLSLPEDIQQGISEGRISTGHAKVLLSIQDPIDQRELYHDVINKGLSVRALEQLIGDSGPGKKHPGRKKASKNAHIRKMEEALISLLGTKVEIKHSGTRGKIEISYYSLEDFERIMELLK
jgi:ParB family transcriptional regulator, chromosome partitioning protein